MIAKKTVNLQNDGYSKRKVLTLRLLKKDWITGKCSAASHFVTIHSAESAVFGANCTARSRCYVYTRQKQCLVNATRLPPSAFAAVAMPSMLCLLLAPATGRRELITAERCQPAFWHLGTTRRPRYMTKFACLTCCCCLPPTPPGCRPPSSPASKSDNSLPAD